jgi:hypothetical protein
MQFLPIKIEPMQFGEIFPAEGMEFPFGFPETEM